jgi:putative DNA primase/helicase
MLSAIQIAGWHLEEARSFFGEIALPPELRIAAILDEWLIGHCRRENSIVVPTSYALQYGPSLTRTRHGLYEALKTLQDRNRARVMKVGRKSVIQLNPMVLTTPATDRISSTSSKSGAEEG